MTEKPKIFILLDGNALVHRAYHALPPLTNKRGESTGAVYGFALTLLSVLSKFKPMYIAASFDLPAPTFRHQKFAEYKATREKAPDDLYAQIPLAKDLVRAFNIPIYEQEGFEADDCVGTLARMAGERGGIETVIVTGDNDALQLVNASTKVFMLRKGIKDTVTYDEAKVFEKYGVPASRLVEWKGLRGDTSDNIPGVSGIGEKTATDLIARFETIKGVYEHIDELSGALKKKLESGRDSAFLSRELSEIHTKAPIVLDIEACRAGDFDRETVEAFLRDYGFVSLLSKVPGAVSGESVNTLATAKKSPKRSPREVLDPATILKEVEHAERVAIALRKEGGTLFGEASQELGIAFLSGGLVRSTSVPFVDPINPAIRAILERENINKISYDEKNIRHVLSNFGIHLGGASDDCMLSGYLLHSGADVRLPFLVETYLGEMLESSTDEWASAILRLSPLLRSKLADIAGTQVRGRTILDLLDRVERPLSPILCAMESRGISLNAEKLGAIAREMARDIAGIEKEIFTLAGREFNIASPKQLAEVLFEDLKIPSERLRRTKTGISTASSELSKLQGEYPIAALVEQYREWMKLKSTYLDVLPALRDGAGHIHTTFHQATTATGRLSSSDPNLQNIPIRSAWGERIRAAFEAASGTVFVGADYSQIELRVAAHLAQDANMMAAFHRGEDIHRTTAALVYHIAPEEVMDEMRRKAKAFNFGILYGMGAFGLSQSAGIPQEEAAQFIQKYLENFSGIKLAMDRMKAFAKEHGYVETELGRRRLLPEIASSNRQIAAQAERMAINMPVQGLEADIVKLAMIAADKLIDETYADRAHMILQVHDELIFEVEEPVAEVFSKDIRRVMESAYSLSVPLVVDVSIGKNWGEI